MTDPMAPLDISLQIQRDTEVYGSHGLHIDAAKRIAEIVLRIAGVRAVAITDTSDILAYAGHGCPNMLPGRPVQTEATRHVLRTGEVALCPSKKELHCSVEGCPCPINAAIIAPLKVQGDVVGTVKLYQARPGPMPGYAQRLAVGISELVGLQAELAEVEHQRELLAQARLEALQAQIRPHFLFNTLNTVIATSRFNPDLARELLTELAAFLRHTISYRGDRITVGEEIEFVNQYLRLEQARFGDRLAIEVRIDPTALAASIPVLALQPLVENGIVHGLAPKDGHGRLTVTVRRRRAYLQLAVIDDGVGIKPERLAKLLQPGSGTGMGLGLANVQERLLGLYGAHARLRVRSREGFGTFVLMRIPFRPGTAGTRPVAD